MNRLMAYIICLVISPSFIFGQNRARNFTIHVSERPISIVNDLESNWNSLKSDSSILFNDIAYVLIQFNEIPTTDDKNRLNLNRIELLNYVTNYAWVAKASPKVKLETLVELNVRKHY